MIFPKKLKAATVILLFILPAWAVAAVELVPESTAQAFSLVDKSGAAVLVVADNVPDVVRIACRTNDSV